MRTMLSRLLDVLLPRRRAERLSQEIQSHLDLLTALLSQMGVSADGACRARSSAVPIDQRAYRDQRGFPLIDGLLQDTKYAVRMIARDRWFTAAAVLALSLGIGASSTMLTILYSMNFRGLPFDEASALMGIGGEPNRTQRGAVPFAVFDAWRSSARGFNGLAAQVNSSINLGDDTNATDQFAGTFISANLFAVLREQPMLGRDFRPDDDRVGAPAVVIIAHRLWMDRYGADPTVIGRTVRVNGQPATVIGVMPEGFFYPTETQVWRPLAALPVMSTPAAGQRPVAIIGRLAGGVSREQARAELAAIASTLTTVPEADRVRRTVMMPLNDTYYGDPFQPAPMMMLTAVFVVLVIACSHAATLLLARSSARTREMSMRAALGASRGRLVRQLLVESVMLALMAGVLGLAAASFGGRAFANETVGFGMPHLDEVHRRWLAVFASRRVVSGEPASACCRRPCIPRESDGGPHQGGRSGDGEPARGRLTGVLLVGELALTVMLLACAGVLVQSNGVVYRADQALDVANLWEFRVALPQPQYEPIERRQAFYRALDERLAAAPGLESAALANTAPFMSGDSRLVLMDNEPLPAAGSQPRTASMVAIGDRYFDTIGLGLVRGTRFEDLDAARRPRRWSTSRSSTSSRRSGSIGRELALHDGAPAAPRAIHDRGVAPPSASRLLGHSPVV